MAFPDRTTIDALRAAVQRSGTLRATAHDLGLPARYGPMFSSILANKKNAVSRKRENDIRHKLNLMPIGISKIYDIPTKLLADMIRWRTEYNPDEPIR